MRRNLAICLSDLTPKGAYSKVEIERQKTLVPLLWITLGTKTCEVEYITWEDVNSYKETDECYDMSKTNYQLLSINISHLLGM